jgi:hypothetical protein
VMAGGNGEEHGRTGGTAHRPFPTRGMHVADTGTGVAVTDRRVVVTGMRAVVAVGPASHERT